MQKFINTFSDLLQDIIPESESDLKHLIELPPDPLMGDLAFPCFQLSKLWKKSPQVIATELAEKLQSLNHPFERIVATGPYVNIFLNHGTLAQEVIGQILKLGKSYGQGQHNNELMLIESPSPNTNKPLHLGHVRNMLLGNSLAALATKAGYTVKKVEVINDRGIHICKSMLAYQLWGNQAQPDKKSDHYVGDWYVRYSIEEEKNPDLKLQAQEMLRKRELGDPEVRALWKIMNSWAIEGMRKTYARYGTHIDEATYESAIYEQGKSVVQRGLEQGVFVKDDKGNIAYPIQKHDGEIGYFVVLRADGTAIYATQDLALVDARRTMFHMHHMIYVIGNEQDDYFKALFEVFEKLGYPFAKHCFHLSYGMISLPEGKMKSRTGNVVDADDIADEMHSEAFEELTIRHPEMSEDQRKTLAEQIAMGAIKFFFLKYDVHKNFVFDPKESLSFEGETGPYIQYTCARLKSIISKSSSTANPNYELLTQQEEKNLIIHLGQYGEYIQQAVSERRPNVIIRYLLESAKLANTYYQKIKILEDNLQVQATRIALIKATLQVMSDGLTLMGIEQPDVM